MRIIFESEQPTHNRIIVDTDWTFAKKLLDIVFDDMTEKAFFRQLSEDNKKEDLR